MKKSRANFNQIRTRGKSRELEESTSRRKKNSRSQNVPESAAEDQEMESGAESQTEYLIFLLVLLYWNFLLNCMI